MTSPADDDRDLLERARAWADGDVDPDDAAALRALAERARGGDAAARADLADRLAGELEFGTAGLRGALGAGPRRMNRAVVVRAAAGLAAHLVAEEAREGLGARTPSVVIGYDARHRSVDFASDSAAVMTAAGLRAWLLPRALPTPVLAAAVRSLGADAGVMVTASHNPAADNGYKVYLGGRDGGSQIVPPDDAAIAARIAAAGAAADVPRAREGWTVLGEGVLDDYTAGVAALVEPAPRDDRRARLSVVATALHGVGGAVLTDVLSRAGFADVTLVPSQAAPDPDFPTVAFPNPEEPGALDAALALARERGADLVLALDPDADRCAVAVPAREGDEGGSGEGDWRVLSGDELGAVLGEQAASAPQPDGATLACSLVSSSLLGRIADAHGLRWEQTLTGFKWISRVDDLVYGYEEAIGYCVAPHLVRDKDGISAALVTAALVADLAADGRSLLDVLDDLARSHGVHATAQVAFRVDEPSVIAGAVSRLRREPPTALAGRAVTGVEDLAEGGLATTGLPPTEGLRWTAAGARVVVRPSGTEPKLKCYLEVVEPVGPDDGLRDGLEVAGERAAAALGQLREEVTRAVGL